MDKTNLCKTCKYKDCPLVPNWKIKDPDLLIVGEAPGEDEVRSGIPFTGSSGQLMRKILRETGFQMSRIAICNTCKCRPPENATPKEKEIALCAGQFLFQEIEEMRPKAILCVGAIASSAFNKDKRLKDVIGEAREWHGMRMMSTYHPAYLLYYPEAESKFRRDLRQLYNILYPVKHERRFVVVDTLEGLAEVKKWAHGKTLMGSDIETNKTLDPFDVNSKILCISFGDDQVSYSISLDKDNDPVYMSEATAFVKQLLGDPHVTHIFHRCWFDVKFLKSRGIDVKRYTDTRLKSFLLNENRLEHGLKELVSEYIGEYSYTMEEKDRHKFGLYNCLNGNAKVMLADGRTEKIKKIVSKMMAVDVLSRDTEGNLSSAHVVGWHRHVDKNTKWLLVRTQNSRYVRHEGTVCTPDHKWYTQRGWVRADALTQTGDSTFAPDRVMMPYQGHDDFIHGTLLGDGYISKKDFLVIRQNCKEYAEEKAEHIGKVCKAYKCRGGYKPGATTYYAEVPVSREWRNRFYGKNGVKIFVPPTSWEAIAIWYGDDGCLASGCAPRFAVHSFDVQAVAEWFREWLRKHGGKGSVSIYNKGNVALTGSDCALFFAVISHYLPASVQYKLPSRYRGKYNNWLKNRSAQWAQVDYVREYNPKKHTATRGLKSVQYCIEVDNSTHTFFTIDGAVANCEDAWSTYKLNQIFDKSMTPGLQNVLDRIILPVIPVLNEMMLTGMEVDIPYAKKLVKTTIKDREKAYHELLKEHKIFRGINLNSGPQMQSVIFGALKEASVKKTKTGESLDETVMNHFAYAGKTWARKILEIRGFDKLLSTYIKKIPKMVNVDGRIRTQFDPMGTVTGRLSSSEPNLQNIPRDNRVYRMFVASKDKVFFYFDFSQMELRIGCSIANELKMIDAFKHPVDAEGHKIDLHIRTAMMIKSKKASEITKDDRQLAKGTSFGLLYGQGAEGLKQYLFDKFGIDIPLKEAERIRKIFFDTYTGLPLWYRRVQGDLMTNHQIIYPTGRIRRFPQIAALGKVTGDIFRRGVNAPVQGSAGDTVLFVMAHLHRLIAKRKMPSKFVNQVHDSVLLEMDNSKALIDDTKELVELVIKDVVQNDSMFRWIKVPLECEYKVGQNWGELTE